VGKIPTIIVGNELQVSASGADTNHFTDNVSSHLANPVGACEELSRNSTFAVLLDAKNPISPGYVQTRNVAQTGRSGLVRAWFLLIYIFIGARRLKTAEMLVQIAISRWAWLNRLP
jgi:hypothetical protein